MEVRFTFLSLTLAILWQRSKLQKFIRLSTQTPNLRSLCECFHTATRYSQFGFLYFAVSQFNSSIRLNDQIASHHGFTLSQPMIKSSFILWMHTTTVETLPSVFIRAVHLNSTQLIPSHLISSCNLSVSLELNTHS